MRERRWLSLGVTAVASAVVGLLVVGAWVAASAVPRGRSTMVWDGSAREVHWTVDAIGWNAGGPYLSHLTGGGAETVAVAGQGDGSVARLTTILRRFTPAGRPRTLWATNAMHMEAADASEEWQAYQVPFPILLCAAAVLPFVWMGTRVRQGLAKRRSDLAGRCRHCGYDLRASPDRCPECGATTTHQ